MFFPQYFVPYCKHGCEENSTKIFEIVSQRGGGAVLKNCDFRRTARFISQLIHDVVIVPMDLSIGDVPVCRLIVNVCFYLR